MSTLAERYALAADAAFRNKLKVAIVKAALAIVGESNSSNPVRTEKRHKLGVAVLTSPDHWIGPFSFAVVAPDTLSSSSTDTAIEDVVSAVWSDLAGVTNAEGG